MSRYVIIECNHCSSARKGDDFPELWKILQTEGWETDKSEKMHFCPVCVMIKQKKNRKKCHE